MVAVLVLTLLLPVSSAAPSLAPKTGYDEVEARALLKLSAGAYAFYHEECVNRTYPGEVDRNVLLTSTNECDLVESSCTSYIVHSQLRKELIVVFRGTKGKLQLLLEGYMSLTPHVEFFGMGTVNSYFYEAHTKTWEPIEVVLNDPAYKDHSVVFTGHSLGGALASLAAARTAVTKIRSSDQIRLVTFGQPRVGGSRFAVNFDAFVPNSYRVVYRRDIVPHSPACAKDESNFTVPEGSSLPCDPYDGVMSYHHGTEIWYPDSMDEGSEYIECVGEPKDEDFSCSDQLVFSPGMFDEYVYDHRHYFGVKAGCQDPLLSIRTTEGVIANLVTGLNTILKKLGAE